ncbi:tRNA (adenosine(37)-N6)-threonylcarbamoyltransferase complex ATPase subunit type 1 TsaE, partial [Candidatus Pelagibacter sp.]|nr:tRNA (adenosine(37)-N6)-threonylcarbamoyltransferase complex ATPase subunit type 1 TsaE [Candidatus Pelagibacter sp.]
MPIATNSEKIDISLEDNIAELAKKFSQILKKGDVVFLHGEIGVGKTTFVKHLINNFQRKKNLDLTEVTSPTFNLVNEYNGGNFIIQHYDLFRLKSIEEIKNLDLFEDISNTIILIE